MKNDRERIIQNYRKRIKNLEQSIEIIREIPVGKAITMTTLIWTKLVQAGKWKRESCQVAGIVRHFNADSVRMELFAVEKAGYPFDKNHPVQAVKFINITSWEPLNKKDLPLLIGYELTYDLLTDALKRS